MNWTLPLGRFGNNLFQYVFAYYYAKTHHDVLCTSNWIGKKLFKINDPPVTRHMPRTQMDNFEFGNTQIDLYGYCQSKKFYDYYTRDDIKNLLRFRGEITDQYSKKIDYYIAAHIRRGDYIKHAPYYCLVQKEAYLQACDKFGLDKTKIIWVSDENKTDNEASQTMLEDFMLLKNADVILRANSTFSLWAAALSDAKVYSPLINTEKGYNIVEFVEGNWPKVDSQDYPGIPPGSRPTDFVLKDEHVVWPQ